MPLSSLSPHARGVFITFLGGLALSFDIPIVRLASGGAWSILTVRSLCTVLITLVIWAVLRLITGKAPVLVPGRAGVIVSIFYSLGSIAFILSVFNTSSANVAFILAFNPMFAALLSWIFLRERPRPATFIAMAAMTVGVLLIVGNGLQSGHLFGDTCAALSALSIACALTYSRATKQDFGFTPMVATILPAIVGGLLAVRTGDLHIASPAWIVFNGLFLTPFAFWALATGPRFLSAAETGMFYLLETVLAPVWVWLVFSEQPPVATLIGGAIILGALIWHSTHTMRREKIPLH
jgi:drug/metabolite transporter (DMT)-like permease